MPLTVLPPSVTVVLDPGDDAIHTHPALAAHHPPSGRITLRPGAGTTSETGLAHDLLAALGKPPLLPGRFPAGRQPAWEAATAFIVHVAIAVGAGSLLGLLPDLAVKLVSAALFAFGAFVLLRSGSDDEDDEAGTKTVTGFWPVYTTAFMAVFISEWGDLTQITTANLAATNGWLPTAIGPAALMSVSALVLLVGKFIAKRVPLKTVQRIGGACMAALAIWTLIEAFTGCPDQPVTNQGTRCGPDGGQRTEPNPAHHFGSPAHPIGKSGLPNPADDTTSRHRPARAPHPPPGSTTGIQVSPDVSTNGTPRLRVSRRQKSPPDSVSGNKGHYRKNHLVTRQRAVTRHIGAPL